MTDPDAESEPEQVEEEVVDETTELPRLRVAGQQ
jgi:hypothetical protein